MSDNEYGLGELDASDFPPVDGAEAPEKEEAPAQTAEDAEVPDEGVYDFDVTPYGEEEAEAPTEDSPPEEDEEETEEDLEEEAIEAPGTEEEAEEVPEKWTFKGKIHKEDYEWKDLTREDITNALQISHVATGKMQEAAATKKQMESFAESILDPETALPTIAKVWARSMGVDALDAEESLWEQVLLPYAQEKIRREALPEIEKRGLETQRRAEAQAAEAEAKIQAANERAIAAHGLEIQTWVKSDLAERGLADEWESKDDFVELEKALVDSLLKGNTYGRSQIKGFIEETLNRRTGGSAINFENLDPDQLLEEHPDLEKKMLQAIAKRQQAKTNQKAPRTPDAGQGRRRRPKAEQEPRSYTSSVDMFENL